MNNELSLMDVQELVLLKDDREQIREIKLEKETE